MAIALHEEKLQACNEEAVIIHNHKRRSNGVGCGGHDDVFQYASCNNRIYILKEMHSMWLMLV